MDGCPQLVPSNPTPWQLNIGPIPLLIEITFQAIVEVFGPPTPLYRISNAVVAGIGF